MSFTLHKNQHSEEKIHTHFHFPPPSHTHIHTPTHTDTHRHPQTHTLTLSPCHTHTRIASMHFFCPCCWRHIITITQCPVGSHPTGKSGNSILVVPQLNNELKIDFKCSNLMLFHCFIWYEHASIIDRLTFILPHVKRVTQFLSWYYNWNIFGLHEPQNIFTLHIYKRHLIIAFEDFRYISVIRLSFLYYGISSLSPMVFQSLKGLKAHIMRRRVRHRVFLATCVVVWCDFLHAYQWLIFSP